MKIAILISSGGSIFRYALQILRECGSPVEFIMISDRKCGAEKIAEDFSLPLTRVEEKDNGEFSIKCKEHLDSIGGADVVMTFIWRLITAELINAYPCVNIHPALLPAFKGFHAVKQAYEAGVKFFGSTLHMVDEEMDHGPIIAQVQTPTFSQMPLSAMTEMFFVQDVYLFLLLVDLLEQQKIEVFPKAKYKATEDLRYTDRCNPCLENLYYLHAIKEMQMRKHLKVI